MNPFALPKMHRWMVLWTFNQWESSSVPLRPMGRWRGGCVLCAVKKASLFSLGLFLFFWLIITRFSFCTLWGKGWQKMKKRKLSWMFLYIYEYTVRCKQPTWKKWKTRFLSRQMQIKKMTSWQIWFVYCLFPPPIMIITFCDPFSNVWHYWHNFAERYRELWLFKNKMSLSSYLCQT